MKKRIITNIVLFLTLMTVTCIGCGAACVEDGGVSVVTERYVTEDGFEVETVLSVHRSTSRASYFTAEKAQTIRDGGKDVAKVTLTAKFGYDGTAAWVENASGSHTTYDGWSYENESVTCSGGTANLSADLTKIGERLLYVSVTLTCSPTGEIR